MWNRLAEIWCRTMHKQPMWPMHGKYICQQCLREYPVAWEGPAKVEEYADARLRSARTAELQIRREAPAVQ